ncbi:MULTISPECIES: LysR family transcriptional regulator [unclassified Streptomyces]|uniref:LysR family transcriptional regulator n=1 Tax=unclassified Streptomyces TaxID=2593676 RepID=UPI00190C0057|nr:MULTISPECIES: LysR family transcriptional regulator [unclassified Streptomyces]MBK3563405.1 LysR family transcriptional regulator [Streptomyces sp. MBT62]MBK6011467.1 LysR family transcriptional regulator [Streptomyces sp. MBT53]
MTDLPPAPDLELRLVRYFIAVAEQRHFGRAAEALHITQPSLSRQVRRLEEQLGARLLDRTPQGTRLTEAGEVFLPRAKGLLRATAQAAAETRAAAEPSRLTVGYMANLFVTPAVREVRRRHPDADVHVVHLAYDDVRAALLERRVDVVVARLPFSTDELEVTVLYDEPRVLLVPLDHRLAGKESVTVDDIADEPVPQVPGADPAWAAFWRIDPRPDGRPAPGGPVVRALADKFEFVADGRAVAIAAGVRPGQTIRPDIVAIPLHGVEPSHVALATRAGEHNRLLSAFRKAAQALLRAPSDAEEHPDGAHQ